LTFSWEADEAADYYRLFISTDKDFAADKTESYLVNTNSLTLSHLYTGTKYYWFVLYTELTEDGGEFNMSSVHTRSFTTAEDPRFFKIDGVSNTRDIGGFETTNGCRVKQGMIYRGGKLEGITEEGKEYFRNVIGITTDLDLRTPGEGGAGSGSPLGEDINYVNINGRYYVGNMGINTEEGKAVFAQEIRVFANPDNYPIYIHCSLGRDRTGTLAMVIEGLLGVKFNDFEMSIGTPDTIIDGNMYLNTLHSRDASGKYIFQQHRIDMASRPSVEFNASYKFMTAGFVDNPYGTDEFYFLAKTKISF
jgi:hypothetical protein